MIFQLTVACCIASALVTIIGFVLYVRARMADRTEDHGLTEEQQTQRLAQLDRDEHRYQTLYFIAGFVFFALGILILVQLSIRLTGPFGHHPIATAPPGAAREIIPCFGGRIALPSSSLPAL